MDYFIITLTLVSGFLYFFGLISLFIKEKLYLSETLASTLFGMLFSSLLNREGSFIDHKFMTQLSRIVLSLQVVAVGISIPKKYILKEWRSLCVILVPLMTLSYITAATIVHLVLGYDLYISLIVGACVTPTDPVLATAILKGKFSNRYIPSHLKNLLTVESGANDGLGYILLTFPLIFLKNKTLTDWFLTTWLKEIILSIAIGSIIGYVARKILIFCKRKKLIDKESFLVSMITLGLFVTGITGLLESDDILACFVCGLFFSWDETYKKDIQESHLLEVIDLLFNHVFFIFFGSLIGYNTLKWEYGIVAVLILIFRRLPFFYLFKCFIKPLQTNREVFFAGWFGPIGVGAVFFGYHAIHELEHMDLEVTKEIMPLINIIVLSSVIVHGLTAPIIHFHLKRKKIGLDDYAESNFSAAEIIER